MHAIIFIQPMGNQENTIREVYEHWNGKGIIVHKRMTPDIHKRIKAALRSYELDEIKVAIDFYATILEPGISPEKRKYWWTYKWNLSEFCMRGIAKFDGQELSNYQKRQSFEIAESSVVIKRNV